MVQNCITFLFNKFESSLSYFAANLGWKFCDLDYFKGDGIFTYLLLDLKIVLTFSKFTMDSFNKGVNAAILNMIKRSKHFHGEFTAKYC